MKDLFKFGFFILNLTLLVPATLFAHPLCKMAVESLAQPGGPWHVADVISPAMLEIAPEPLQERIIVMSDRVRQALGKNGLQVRKASHDRELQADRPSNQIITNDGIPVVMAVTPEGKIDFAGETAGGVTIKVEDSHSVDGVSIRRVPDEVTASEGIGMIVYVWDESRAKGEEILFVATPPGYEEREVQTLVFAKRLLNGYRPAAGL